MSESQTMLNDRIKSCRDLLDVFREERRLLLSDNSVEPSRIVTGLKLKLKLANSVSEDLDVIRKTSSENAIDEAEENTRRAQIRELGALLEELLVIERENQRLLRNLVDATTTGPPERTGATEGDGRTAARARETTPLVSRLQQIRTRNRTTPR